MSSTVYLFEPAPAKAEKPLVEIMREAEIARSREAARIFRNFANSVADYFGRVTSSEDEVAPRAANTNDEETRLAA